MSTPRKGTKKTKAVVYKAIAGSRIKDADAMIVGPVCESLARRHGVARPEDLLTESRDPKSPTHRFFEWDNSKAAEAYRVDQARYLMRSYTVVLERSETKQEVRGLQYVDSKGGYVPSAIVFSDGNMTHEVVERAKREAASWYHRHQQLRAVAELSGVFDAIESAIVKADTEAAAE
jgi:hypothetical protein